MQSTCPQSIQQSAQDAIDFIQFVVELGRIRAEAVADDIDRIQIQGNQAGPGRIRKVEPAKHSVNP